MTENPYWTMDDPQGRTAEELEHLEPEMQNEVLKAWFHRNFEDPAESTPHNSAEGGYQYIWGGPYDADEELPSEFEPLGVPDEVIGEIVEKVTRDGVYWAPTHDRLADRWSDRIDESWCPLPLEEPEIPRPAEEMAARQNVVERIGALEERLGALEENPPVVAYVELHIHKSAPTLRWPRRRMAVCSGAASIGVGSWKGRRVGRSPAGPCHSIGR